MTLSEMLAMYARLEIGLIAPYRYIKSAPKAIGFVLSSRRKASNSFATGQKPPNRCGCILQNRKPDQSLCQPTVGHVLQERHSDLGPHHAC